MSVRPNLTVGTASRRKKKVTGVLFTTRKCFFWGPRSTGLSDDDRGIGKG